MKKISLVLTIIGVILISLGIILLSTNVNAKSEYNSINDTYGMSIYVDEKTCNEYIVVFGGEEKSITPRYGTYSNTGAGTSQYILQNKYCLKKKERK